MSVTPFHVEYDFRCKFVASRKAKGGRGARIRTEDFLLPKQARYRAAPRPDKGVKNLGNR